MDMGEDAVEGLSKAARCRRMLRDLIIENRYPRTRLCDSLIEQCKLLGIVCVTRKNGGAPLQLSKDVFQRNGTSMSRSRGRRRRQIGEIRRHRREGRIKLLPVAIAPSLQQLARSFSSCLCCIALLRRHARLHSCPLCNHCSNVAPGLCQPLKLGLGSLAFELSQRLL